MGADDDVSAAGIRVRNISPDIAAPCRNAHALSMRNHPSLNRPRSDKSESLMEGSGGFDAARPVPSFPRRKS